jgi:hypothetical protein
MKSAFSKQPPIPHAGFCFGLFRAGVGIVGQLLKGGEEDPFEPSALAAWKAAGWGPDVSDGVRCEAETWIVVSDQGAQRGNEVVPAIT